MIKFLTPYTFLSSHVLLYTIGKYCRARSDLYQLSEKEKNKHFQLIVEVILFSYEPPHDKTNKMICAPSKESDQPGHPPSLIRVFPVRSMGS